MQSVYQDNNKRKGFVQVVIAKIRLLEGRLDAGDLHLWRSDALGLTLKPNCTGNWQLGAACITHV